MRPILGILGALEAAHVDCVVVGGVAVVLQGHPRMTVDLDLALDLSRDNVLRALQALTDVGLRPRLPVRAEDFADAEIRNGWVSERNLVAFTMHDPTDPLTEVDLLATTEIAYEHLAQNAEEMVIDGIRVRVACVEDLMTMKRAAGRPQDLADMAALSALRARPSLDGDESPT